MNLNLENRKKNMYENKYNTDLWYRHLLHHSLCRNELKMIIRGLDVYHLNILVLLVYLQKIGNISINCNIYCNKVHIPSKLKYWTIRQCVFSGEHSLGSLGLSIQFKSSIKLHWWHFKLCDVSEMRNQIEFEIVSKQIID